MWHFLCPFPSFKDFRHLANEGYSFKDIAHRAKIHFLNLCHSRWTWSRYYAIGADICCWGIILKQITDKMNCVWVLTILLLSGRYYMRSSVDKCFWHNCLMLYNGDWTEEVQKKFEKIIKVLYNDFSTQLNLQSGDSILWLYLSSTGL